MLIRPDDDGAVVLITQPAHSWLSGQLARAWADDEEPMSPREELCIAAEQHDIGWLQWEATPTLNQETGLPYSFREMPRKMHLQIWGRARRYAMIYGRYPALMISMHGTGLFERFGPSEDAPSNEKLQVDTFLRRERASQQQLIDALAADPRYEDVMDPEHLERNRSLMSVWDGLSLMICEGVDEEGVTIGDFTLMPGEEEETITVDPWPFRGTELEVFAEAKRLHGRFDRPVTLNGGLAQAEQFVLEWTLLPTDDAESVE
ncbi:MAG: DUF3891 family protein [Sphaerobacteraceae bacterium]|nr:MAG: DUF3891 family protein [Sphaerobacteraceae bacterium]